METTKIQINCLKDLLENAQAFAGKYITYQDYGLWYLDDQKYVLEPRLFTALDENIRLFNFRYTTSGGSRCYYINESDIYNYFNKYQMFLFKLLKLTKDKKFTTLTQIREFFVNHNYSATCNLVRFPLSTQGRYDDIKCLIIRGRNEYHDKCLFLPYYGFASNLTNKNKIFKNILRIFILLYEPHLDYPFAYRGSKKIFEDICNMLYSEIEKGMVDNEQQ